MTQWKDTLAYHQASFTTTYKLSEYTVKIEGGTFTIIKPANSDMNFFYDIFEIDSLYLAWVVWLIETKKVTYLHHTTYQQNRTNPERIWVDNNPSGLV